MYSVYTIEGLLFLMFIGILLVIFIHNIQMIMPKNENETQQDLEILKVIPRTGKG